MANWGMFDILLFAVLGFSLIIWAETFSDYGMKSFGTAPVIRTLKDTLFAVWFVRFSGFAWIALALFLFGTGN